MRRIKLPHKIAQSCATRVVHGSPFRCPESPLKSGNKGFTLIEILVVLSIVATLLTLVAPRYFDTIDRSREASLRHDLDIMRDALDKYYSDNGVYPDALDQLVEKKYLKRIPVDPITKSDQTWTVAPPPDPNLIGSVYDVRSGSEEVASDGSSYAEW